MSLPFVMGRAAGAGAATGLAKHPSVAACVVAGRDCGEAEEK